MKGAPFAAILLLGTSGDVVLPLRLLGFTSSKMNMPITSKMSKKIIFLFVPFRWYPVAYNSTVIIDFGANTIIRTYHDEFCLSSLDIYRHIFHVIVNSV